MADRFYCYGKKDYCDCRIPCIDCKYMDNTGGRYDRQQTNGDRIRSMNDEQLAHLILNFSQNGFFCQNEIECSDMLDNEQEIPEEKCKACALAWLKTPMDERPGWIVDEKQESGLIEED